MGRMSRLKSTGLLAAEAVRAAKTVISKAHQIDFGLGVDTVTMKPKTAGICKTFRKSGKVRKWAALFQNGARVVSTRSAPPLPHAAVWDKPRSEPDKKNRFA